MIELLKLSTFAFALAILLAAVWLGLTYVWEKEYFPVVTVIKQCSRGWLAYSFYSMLALWLGINQTGVTSLQPAFLVGVPVLFFLGSLWIALLHGFMERLVNGPVKPSKPTGYLFIPGELPSLEEPSQ